MVVVGSEPALAGIATGLRRTGLAVATSRATAGYDAALADAAEAVGRPDVVVWALTPPELGRPRPVTTIDDAGWRDMVGATLRSYIEFLQAAERVLRTAGGRLIVVVPTIAMSGAADLAAWSAVAEGQRALAKSVARVWGTNAVTVNCVAVPARLLVDATDDLDRPHLQSAALPDPDLGHDVAGAIAALCADGLAPVTGATIGVDGGRWIAS